MPALHEIQELFKESLLGGASSALLDLVEADGLDPEACLAVYRHHVFTTLTAALEAAFPVVCRLVDPRFFAYAADAFVRQHPPAGPCLDEYGGAFADFLAAFEASTHLSWLPDVARLEWAIHRATNAPAAEPLDPVRLARVAAADMARLRFVPIPGLAYLASPWPVDAIWRAHQEPVRVLPDLAAGSVCLEVTRSAEGIRVRSLDPLSFTFRRTLAEGHTLGEAAEGASHLDLMDLIRDFLEANIFGSFTVATAEGA